MTRDEARRSWEEHGYTVHGDCPECGHGFLVTKAGWHRQVCTSYGACELSVG
jgi:hypothetical protein